VQRDAALLAAAAGEVEIGQAGLAHWDRRIDCE
jgi:hypothetical protein